MKKPLSLFFLLFFVLGSTVGFCDVLKQKPAKIIFDTDMGSDCDDVGALALLHHYADLGLAEIEGCVFSSGKIPYGAGIVEAINIYYGRPDIPVGAYHKEDIGDPVDKMGTEKLAKDTVAYGNTIIHNHDATEQTILSRKILAGQDDKSITYITVGHTKGLYDLLTSESDDISPLNGKELIQKKLKSWIALGALNANNKENKFTKDWNFYFNGTAPYTKYLVENIPAPVFYINAGSDVMTGKSLKTTLPGNIVRTAYRDWLWWHDKRTFDDQRPSWDLTAVYFAVEGLGKFLVNEGKGRLEFDIEQGSRWTTDIDISNQSYIVQKRGVTNEFSDYLNSKISIPPKR